MIKGTENVTSAVDDLWKRIRNASFSRQDPVSFAFGNLEYMKAVAAVFSILTLHMIFFCLNIDFRLWPLIDFSLLVNITFSFGLVVALALFVIRFVPFIATIIGLFIIMYYLGAVTLKRRLRSPSRYAQEVFIPYPIPKLLEATGPKGKMFLISLTLMPLPSRAATMLARKWQETLVTKFIPKIAIIGYAAAILLICFLYTGFWLLVYFFLTVVFLFLFFVSSNFNREGVVEFFELLVEKTRVEERIQKFANLDERIKKSVVTGLLVTFGALSAVSGDLRYGFLTDGQSSELKLGSTDRLTVVQFASNSEGIFVVDAEDHQMFVPFGSITLIAASRSLDD
jgi:hypothetical protein